MTGPSGWILHRKALVCQIYNRLEKRDELGRFWEPEDENDAAFLAMAEGAIFGNTTFPSGWTSPAGKVVDAFNRWLNVESSI